MKRLYRHAQIASEDSPKLLNADVLVEAGRIIGVAPEITGVTDCEIIDCTGRILLPSLFDIHVHAREPGQEDKENIASCAEAAINGGVTGFVMMPNTRLPSTTQVSSAPSWKVPVAPASGPPFSPPEPSPRAAKAKISQASPR
jgi:dihydroorotase-like cyclic amidohydrolase